MRKKAKQHLHEAKEDTYSLLSHIKLYVGRDLVMLPTGGEDKIDYNTYDEGIANIDQLLI
jgi:hypothetical protein